MIRSASVTQSAGDVLALVSEVAAGRVPEPRLGGVGEATLAVVAAPAGRLQGPPYKICEFVAILILWKSSSALGTMTTELSPLTRQARVGSACSAFKPGGPSVLNVRLGSGGGGDLHCFQHEDACRDSPLHNEVK